MLRPSADQLEPTFLKIAILSSLFMEFRISGEPRETASWRWLITLSGIAEAPEAYRQNRKARCDSQSNQHSTKLRDRRKERGPNLFGRLATENPSICELGSQVFPNAPSRETPTFS